MGLAIVRIFSALFLLISCLLLINNWGHVSSAVSTLGALGDSGNTGDRVYGVIVLGLMMTLILGAISIIVNGLRCHDNHRHNSRSGHHVETTERRREKRYPDVQ